MRRVSTRQRQHTHRAIGQTPSNRAFQPCVVMATGCHTSTRSHLSVGRIACNRRPRGNGSAPDTCIAPCCRPLGTASPRLWTDPIGIWVAPRRPLMPRHGRQFRKVGPRSLPPAVDNRTRRESRGPRTDVGVTAKSRGSSTAAKYSNASTARRCSPRFARAQRASAPLSESYAFTLQARG
jgi:hypothetical protein